MQKKNRGMIIAFVTPALLFFVATFVYPIIRTVMMIFFKIDNITAPMAQWTFAGFDNYIKLINTPVFMTACTNLLKIWLYGGIVVMTLALLFAVILSSGIRGKKFFRAVIYLPNIVSAVALAIMWQQYVYSNQYGLLKPLGDLLGFQWLDTDHKFLALLIAYCFGMVGYHMLIFLSGIESIGTQYYEASTIDGAGKVSQFRYITLPLLKGCFKTNITMWSISSVGFFLWSQLFSTVTIFNFINIWNEYFLSLIFANSDKMRPVAVGLYSMINSMKYTGDWSGMFAAVVIVFLPTFFLYIFLSEKIIAGVTAGGVKG